MSSSALPAISVRPPSPDPNEPEQPMLTPGLPSSQSQSAVAVRQNRTSRQSSLTMDSTKPLPRVPRKPSSNTRTSIPIPELSAPSSLSLESNSTTTSGTEDHDTSASASGISQSQTPLSSAPSLHDTAVSISIAPPLTRVHFSCYQSHRTFVPSRNTHYPLPCMTCLRSDDKNAPRFRCTFCCLRICGECVGGLKKCGGRSLMVFMEELVRMLEGEGEKEKEG